MKKKVTRKEVKATMDFYGSFNDTKRHVKKTVYKIIKVTVVESLNTTLYMKSTDFDFNMLNDYYMSNSFIVNSMGLFNTTQSDAVTFAKLLQGKKHIKINNWYQIKK